MRFILYKQRLLTCYMRWSLKSRTFFVISIESTHNSDDKFRHLWLQILEKRDKIWVILLE